MPPARTEQGRSPGPRPRSPRSAVLTKFSTPSRPRDQRRDAWCATAPLDLLLFMEVDAGGARRARTAMARRVQLRCGGERPLLPITTGGFNATVAAHPNYYWMP